MSIKNEAVAELLSSPTKVYNSLNKIQFVELDESDEPMLFDNNGLPVAVVTLSNGDGATLRFDTNPPRLSGFEFKPNRFLIDETDFLILVKAVRAGKSVESFIFYELFRYPFQVAHPDTGELETIILVQPFFIYNVGGVPVALVGTEPNIYSAIRFNCCPPVFCDLDVNTGIQLYDKAEFVSLVKNTSPRLIEEISKR